MIYADDTQEAKPSARPMVTAEQGNPLLRKIDQERVPRYLNMGGCFWALRQAGASSRHERPGVTDDLNSEREAPDAVVQHSDGARTMPWMTRLEDLLRSQEPRNSLHWFRYLPTALAVEAAEGPLYGPERPLAEPGATNAVGQKRPIVLKVGSEAAAAAAAEAARLAAAPTSPKPGRRQQHLRHRTLCRRQLAAK